MGVIMDDRRRSRRIDLSGEIIIKEIGSQKEETVDIKITDASSVGVGFITQKQLTIGDNYEANLAIWTKEILHVFIKIIRASVDEDGYHYGGLFIGMPEDVKQRIDVYEIVEDEKAKLEGK